MIDHYKAWVLGQYEAALWMLHDCVQKCPARHWSGPTAIIGKYEFWHVVHHTLSCTDYYLSRDEASFALLPEFYPAGASDFEGEYPSRMFSQDELTSYLMICLNKLRTSLAAETESSLAGHCGFPHQKLSRGEVYLYSLRHVMHHVGQLSAFLRRLGEEPRWGSAGWK